MQKYNRRSNSRGNFKGNKPQRNSTSAFVNSESAAALLREATLPTVAIVGRPNVGKSSLFNALIGRRLSIVHEMSGVTRDRLMAVASWQGRHFQLVDTGGLGTMGATRGVDVWDEHIAEQVFSAVADADLLILVVNVQQGIVAMDEDVVRRLRETGKPILLAVNKCDTMEAERTMDEFSRFGLPQMCPVSCLHRRGINDLLDLVAAHLPAANAELETPLEETASVSEENVDCSEETSGEAEETEPNTVDVAAAPAPGVLKIALCGRPNVGKSSLVNALLGEDRVIVSEVAGTTRDAIDVDFAISYRGENRPALLIDTAGLRKKSKVDNAVEMFSVMRAKQAMERADLVLFVLEGGLESITAQDRRIAGEIEAAHKACILVSNKYDLHATEAKLKELQDELRSNFPGLSYAPVVFVSAKKRMNLPLLLDTISQVAEQLEIRLSTGLVNRVLMDAFERLSPPVVGVSPLKIYYASMVGQAPPKFLIFVNQVKNCAPNYLSYLRNALRQAFDLTGLPILIELRARPKKVENYHTPSRNTPHSGRASQSQSRGRRGR